MNAGARLRQAKDQVLRTWAARARERLPAARQRDALVLIDQMPGFSDYVVNVLESPTPRGALASAQPGAAQEHGRERALDPEWSLGEIVGEYQLLQAEMLAELERGGGLRAEERDIILEAMATAVRNALAEFERLRSFEQNERATVSEQRFALFVEAVRDYAIFTVDPLGFITSWIFRSG